MRDGTWGWKGRGILLVVCGAVVRGPRWAVDRAEGVDAGCSSLAAYTVDDHDN